MNDYWLYSPLDYRYSVGALRPFLSEEAFITYKAKIEGVLAKTLSEHGICSENVAEEIYEAASQVRAKDVYAEEKIVKHDIRALVNIIRNQVSPEAKPFVHVTATSYDIVDNANVLRYKDAIQQIILPDMVALERTWIDLARKEKNTIQIGRTHGQHAEPITFGFAIAQYVNRWGYRILKVKEAINGLVGKFSGAVGAYNAASLFFDDPELFEMELLANLNLEAAEISTQIIPPEPITDLMHTIISSFGVLANFARDMRNLQRSEIGEVNELFAEKQVGSSTMPHKKNPINFENVESMWKKFMPQMITMYSDQISEHQRDLTNSCSQRFTPELMVAFDSSIRRMNRVSKNLQINRNNLQKNFETSKEWIIAEPLYTLLAHHGHPSAHEYIRIMVMKSYESKRSLIKIVLADTEIQPYLEKFTSNQLELLKDPRKYIGVAPEKTEKTLRIWERRLKDNGFSHSTQDLK